MAKALTITGVVISAVILPLFLLDLIAARVIPALAPFKGASLLMDVSFIICAAILAYLSWTTYREFG